VPNNLLLPNNLPLPGNLLLRNGRLLDVASGAYTEGDLLAADGRIAETGPRLAAPNDAEVRDLRGAFVLPGLIDAHVHVTAITADLGTIRKSSPFYVAAHAARIMGEMLDRGFTTVRDVAGGDFGLAAAQAEGLIRGPRLYFGGRGLSQTGGHGDDRGAGDDSWSDPHAACADCRVADGVDQVRLAARDELRKGSHHIKVMASGGVASPTDRVDSVQYSMEELRAIVDEASACNRYVAAHAYTARAVNRALEAGVRSIEHGNLIDDESVSLLIRYDAFLVPTLVTYWALKREGREFGLPEASWRKVDDVLHAGLSALELAYRGGVPLVYGTDLLGGMHRHQNEEFRIRARVQPAVDIIRSATSIAARLLGAEGELGTLEPGARADLVVVDDDPLQDIGVLADPAKHMPLVIQGGAVVRSLGPYWLGLHGFGQDTPELHGDPVGADVQLSGRVERELQPGQGAPLQVQVLGEDRHLIVDRVLHGGRVVGETRRGQRLVHEAAVFIHRLRSERKELPAAGVEELKQQRGVQWRLVAVGHPPPLYRGHRAVLHGRVVHVGERVLADRGERQAVARDVGPGDRLGAGAADRRGVHEREVRLVEKVVDHDRRVRRHPHDGHDHRGDVLAVRQRRLRRPRRPRRPRCQPDDPVLLGDRGRALERGPGRDGRVLIQRGDQRAGTIGGETPAVVGALQRAVYDLASGQPGTAVRARVRERGHGATFWPVDADQRPVLAGQPDRDRLGGHLAGKRDRVPVVRQRRVDVGEFGGIHSSSVVRAEWARYREQSSRGADRGDRGVHP
jgi:imidazolonepropionase-like amidohydrolase